MHGVLGSTWPLTLSTVNEGGSLHGESFGQAVRRHRQRAGLSLAGLAERVAFVKSYISKVETGHKRAIGRNLVPHRGLPEVGDLLADLRAG